MRTNVRKTTPESLASKSLRSSSTTVVNLGWKSAGLGFESLAGHQHRGPGRHRNLLLGLCAVYDPFTTLFAGPPFLA